MFPKAVRAGKTIQNGPCWQWEAGEAGRFEEALKGLGEKKVPNVGGNLGRNERGVVEQSTRWLQPHGACNMLH